VRTERRLSYGSRGGFWGGRVEHTFRVIDMQRLVKIKARDTGQSLAIAFPYGDIDDKAIDRISDAVAKLDWILSSLGGAGVILELDVQDD